MSTITKILHFEPHDTYAIVHVQTNDGTEAQVYIGGDVELFFHRDKVKAFVKKNRLDNDTHVVVDSSKEI